MGGPPFGRPAPALACRSPAEKVKDRADAFWRPPDLCIAGQFFFFFQIVRPPIALPENTSSSAHSSGRLSSPVWGIGPS